MLRIAKILLSWERRLGILEGLSLGRSRFADKVNDASAYVAASIWFARLPRSSATPSRRPGRVPAFECHEMAERRSISSISEQQWRIENEKRHCVDLFGPQRLNCRLTRKLGSCESSATGSQATLLRSSVSNYRPFADAWRKGA